MMKKTVALAAFATLVLVGPVWGQQRNKEDKRGLNSDPLEALARKAALRLAGFEPQEGEEADPDGSTDVAKPKLRVYYDENGMLMVDGRPDEIARFEHAYDLVIEKMRQVGPAKPDIRKYKCRHIDVSLAAALLDDIFNGPQKARQRAAAQQRGRQQPQRARQPQRGRQPEPEPEPEPQTGGMGRGMGMLETLFGGGEAKATDPTELMGIQIVPDKRTNYLFIMAKTDLFPQIIDTLYTIDVETLKEPSESTIVVLERLNADEVKTMLEELLGITDARAARQAGSQARRTAQQRRGRGQQGQAAAQLAAQMQEELMQIGGGEQFKLSDIKISSLAATNTIIVFGPEEARKSIVKIIKELDEQGPDPRVVSIPVESADAVALAKTLQDTFGGTGKNKESNITITGNAEGSVIYVSAPDNIRDEIIQQIGLAESRATAKDEPKTIKIQLGDAESIAAILDVVFKERTKGRGKITITADKTTNQVIVLAPNAIYKEIAALAAEMDQPSQQIVPKFYALVHAYAPEVKVQVQDMVRQLVLSGVDKSALGGFGVTADAATNSLIVMGTPLIFPLMDEVVRQIDAPPKDPTRRTTKTIPLAKNDAREVANNITKLFAGGGKKREGVDPPTAEANVSTNAVIVAGTLKQIEEIEKFIKSLEDIATPPEGGELREYTIALEHVDADQAADMINSFFTQLNAAREAVGVRVKDTEKTVTVVPDMISGKLFVNATEENKGKIDLLLAGIDTEGASEVGARQTEVFQLKFSDPNNLVNAINQSFATSRRVPEKEKVTAVAERGTQSVIVTANERNLERVRAIIEQVDIGTGQEQVVEYYQVKEARAVDVGNIVRQYLNETQPRTRRGKMPVSVVADPNTNSLIISGTQKEVTPIKELIAKLDVKPEEGVGRFVKVHQISYANLDSMVNAINQAFTVRGAKPEDKVNVTRDWDTGTLIVNANQEKHDQIERMLEEIDKESRGGGRRFHTVAVLNADVNDVGQALQQVIDKARGQRGQTKPTLSINPTTNSLIVYASDNEMANFAPLIEAMDIKGNGLARSRDTKVFRLQYSDPNNVASIINQSFRKRGRVPEKEQVTAAVDRGTQSVVVTASLTNLELVGKMIGELDIKGNKEKITVVYQVEEARATELANILNQRLRQTASRTRQGQMPTTIVADEATNSLVITTTQAEYDDELMPIIEKLDVKRKANVGRYIKVYRVKYANLGSVWAAIDGAFNRGRGIKEEDRVNGSVDWETGTLIITANQDRHDEIEKMLAEIDTETAGGRKIHMVKMEYGDAGAVAQALDQIIRAQKVERGQSKPTVTADAGTNTLIVYASESELASFQTVIDSMDMEGSARRAPQRIELEHANAAQLADLLTQIFTVPAQQMQRGRRGGTQKIVPLIIPDDASNTLIVRAQQLEFDQIEDMVAELDIESEDGPSNTRIISVAEGMDVDSMASELERLINNGERERARSNRNYKPKNVSIMAHARSRSLVVSGASAQFDEVERIVRALEKEGAAGPREIRIIRFDHIRSGDAKRVLDQIIEQRNKSRGRRRR
ncbi:MAG: hypothetical protein IID34_02685 [Planctomycetes bacterium]|nr:hypothetical protein [Planctomycetota bacterium]